MITHEPSAVMRSVGITMSEELIATLDTIREALAGTDGEVASRSDIARQLLEFGAFLIQSKSSKVAPLLKAYEDDLASRMGVSA